ncbi:hypothetical protein CBR_g49422 [Chara braunii]|uniref:IPT/TIG domain-containing protein n=1 Tax=Chara braunii TaxID=69332 RepID=A0A388M587_CHABU|nr:hypothetical protein CBR_g49422 [Chara braunii]|eukprot:GBG89632.1 hypothetical protein CBR_g49422 [Chara braunii]
MAPVVLGANPNHSPRAGSKVVIIRGQNFGTTDSFPIAKIGGIPCQITRWISDDVIRCVVPPGQGVHLTVQVTRGQDQPKEGLFQPSYMFTEDTLWIPCYTLPGNFEQVNMEYSVTQSLAPETIQCFITGRVNHSPSVHNSRKRDILSVADKGVDVVQLTDLDRYMLVNPRQVKVSATALKVAVLRK